jgi:hypothetical protein
VVLVGERRAEQRHDAVAHDLVHRALEPVHRLHHVLEYRVEQLPPLLGVAVGEQLHRALEVGDEDGDLLALTFERGLGRQDALGEVLRGVGLGGGEAAGWGAALERRTAFPAELLARGIRVAAARADGREPRATLAAELLGTRVVVLAAGTARTGALHGSGRLRNEKSRRA